MSNITTKEDFLNSSPNMRKFILAELRLKYTRIGKRFRTTKANVSYAVNNKNKELLDRIAVLVEKESTKKNTVN